MSLSEETYERSASQAPDIRDVMRALVLDGVGFARLRIARLPLFTRESYVHYGDDLLARMTNPFLLDTVERVGRDPARKLGWDDRLVGTMRMAFG